MKPSSQEPYYALVLTLLFLPFLSHGADIPLGSSLSPTDSSSWSSPTSAFSLSFTPSPTSPSLFVAAVSVSVAGVPVWSAGGGAGVDSRGALRLAPSGDLQLVNGSGAVVWSASTAGRGVAAAAVLDTGNLVLKNAVSVPLWQSFEHPTDTIVASQRFTSNQTLTAGDYSFSLGGSAGNLTLQWRGTVTYYNKGFGALTWPALTIQPNGIVSLSNGARNASAVVAYSSNYGESGDMLRFLRLDDDGNLRAYSAVRGIRAAPAEQWAAVADQCRVFGYCGNMGVCSYGEAAPACGCPSRDFEPADPARPRSGCRRKAELGSCPGNTTMRTLASTVFLTYPPELATEEFFVGVTACRLNCLSGSSCVAATALGDGSGLCYLKVSNFVSAYRSAMLPSTSSVKVCAPGVPNI